MPGQHLDPLPFDIAGLYVAVAAILVVCAVVEFVHDWRVARTVNLREWRMIAVGVGVVAAVAGALTLLLGAFNALALSTLVYELVRGRAACPSSPGSTAS